jgi:hypothetical protein
MLISKKNETFWGKVELDDGTVYTISRVSPSANYLLKQILMDHYQKDDCRNLRQEENPGEAEQPIRAVTNICQASSSCDPDVVKMLVAYNTSARNDLGGTDDAAIAAIAAAVSEMNLICTNSSVMHSFSLAHASWVSYTESGSSSTDLSRLKVPTDGYIDTIHFLRDKYYADLVSLVLGSGSCGRGNVNSSPTQFSASSAFSVVSDGCMTGNKTLAHESGHNLSLRHDRYAYGSTLPGNACDFGWGYINQEAFGGSVSQRWRTVMAYNDQCSDAGFNCTRITQWSNPDVNYLGDPTGEIIGDPDEAHNAFILDRSMCWASEFRTEPDCSGCSIRIGCANYDPNTDNGVSTLVQIHEAMPFANPFAGNVQVCVVTFGDNNSSSEDFDVKDENGTVLGLTAASAECAYPGRACFDISPALYNSWLADGGTYFELAPTTNSINPDLCSANRACVEILIPDAPDCLPGGAYGESGEIRMLPPGTYDFSGNVTLTGFYLPAGALVTMRCNGEINLEEILELEPTSQLIVEENTGCPE